MPSTQRLSFLLPAAAVLGQEALSSSHAYHLLCALLTGFLFAAHLPERLAPGRFDYIGEHKPGSAQAGLAEQGDWNMGYPSQEGCPSPPSTAPHPALSNHRI